MSAEVKPGYKQTEMGVIPQDWEIKRLRDISPSQTVGLVINPSSYFNESGTVPMLVGSHVSENSISWQSANKITEKSNNQIPASRLYVDDLVMVRVGDPGVTAVIPPELDGCNCASMMIIRQGREFDSNWLCFVMNSNIGRKQVENVQYGTAQKQFNISDAINFIYPTPPLAEQRAIASALCGIEAQINGLDHLLAKKRDIQQATMQQLLTGQRRLPGFSGAWDVKPMRALGNTYGGLAGKTKKDFGHGEARYIPFMNVMTDTVIDAGWLEPVDVAPDEAQNLTKKGDLFFNGSSETPEEVGFCSVLLEDIPNLYLNSFCFGFRFNTAAKVNGLFFAYWFRSKAGRAATSVLAQGATRYNIAKSAFMQLEIPQPTEAEQTAIASILSDMDTEIAALETRRDKAKQLKQGLTQELLTGRIRLV